MSVHRRTPVFVVAGAVVAGALFVALEAGAEHGPPIDRSAVPPPPSAGGAANEVETRAHREQVDSVADGASRPLLPVDPALHGVAPPVDPGVLPASDYRGPSDPAVLDAYRTLSLALEKMRADRPEQRSRAQATYEAITQLINEQRFHYLGAPSLAPKLEQSDSVRYAQIVRSNVAMIFALTRSEFPDVFEPDPARARAAAVRAEIEKRRAK